MEGTHQKKSVQGIYNPETDNKILSLYAPYIGKAAVEPVYAVQEYHIHGTHFTMPKAEKKQLDVLSSVERKKLEQYLLQTGLTIDLAILLCLFTGLRVGELCGLQWSDIDFENGTLSVKRTVQRVYRNGSSEVLIGSPKSRTSVRTIPVPSFLLTLLEKKKRQDFLYLITGKSKPAEPRTMQYRFQSLCS